MSIKEFTQSLKFSFNYKKNLFVFPFLFLCSFLLFSCHELVTKAQNWLLLSLAFIPILLCGSLLLTLGIFLARIYHAEKQKQPIDFWEMFHLSIKKLFRFSSLALPLTLIFLLKKLIVFSCMGVLVFFKSFHLMSPFTEELLSWVIPTVIALGVFSVSFLSLFFLYFLTPRIAIFSQESAPLSLVKETFVSIKSHFFQHFFLFGMGLLPLGIFGALLFCLNWFYPSDHILFSLLLYSLVLTPATIFFFNFSSETYLLIQKQNSSQKNSLSEPH